MYKTVSSGLPTPHIIDHSGFLLKIGIYCVCRGPAKHQSQTAAGALMAPSPPHLLLLDHSRSYYSELPFTPYVKFSCTNVAPASSKDCPVPERCLWE